VADVGHRGIVQHRLLGLRELAQGFLLFRIFDVLKPCRIRRLEELPGGWGIVADDLGGGAAAGALTLALFALLAASRLSGWTAVWRCSTSRSGEIGRRAVARRGGNRGLQAPQRINVAAGASLCARSTSRSIS